MSNTPAAPLDLDTLSVEELAQLLAGAKPSFGRAARTSRSTAEIGSRGGGVKPQSVHGTDDRVVLNNTCAATRAPALRQHRRGLQHAGVGRLLGRQRAGARKTGGR
jgi:hypothetical protein